MDISAETFQQIVQSIKSDGGDASGKRRTPRIGLRGRVTIVPLSAGNRSEKPQSVQVRNLSAQGMAILHNRTMERGQRFVLRLEAHQEDVETQAIVCRVIRCADLGDKLYEIGVEFVGELASSTDASDQGIMLASGFFGQSTPESKALEERVRNAILSDPPMKKKTPATEAKPTDAATPKTEAA